MDFTSEQKERFINHLADCHSWYKHLSLIDGGLFIITVDKDSGENYPSLHPKLPFGNSREAYREAFGNLTYLWKLPDDMYFYSDDRDHNYLQEYIESIEMKSTFKLYPYVSVDFIESIDFHEPDFIDIIKNMNHEESEVLGNIFNQYREYNDYWSNILTEEEQELIFSDESVRYNSRIRKYLSMEQRISVLVERLREKEILKISNAIDRIQFLH